MPTHNEIMTTWRSLCSKGTPPSPEISAKVMPEWSVGIDEWIDRLVKTYLRDHCVGGMDGKRGNSEFKLLVAEYGGGKTHFLHAFRGRALSEGYAVCYIQCKGNEVSFHDWMSLYSMIARSIRLPGCESQGIRQIIESAKNSLVSISHKAPNPDAAFEALLNDLAFREYPNSDFLEIISKSIRLLHERKNPELVMASVNFLQDGQLTATADDLKKLGISRLSANQLSSIGREMFYSLVKFVTEFCDCKGLVLLMDEMDMMFTARGKSLNKLLAGMRDTIDQGDDRLNSIPVFGLFAVVPSVNELMQSNYSALDQRFRVYVPFHAGNDNAAQIDLQHLAEPNALLRAIGQKLVSLAQSALGREFNQELQRKNIATLVQVIEDRVFTNVDSRRLFVKSWSALLDEQHRMGERVYDASTINQLIQGTYQGITAQEASTEEDDG